MIPNVQPIPALNISTLDRGLPAATRFRVVRPDEAFDDRAATPSVDARSPSLRGRRAGDLPACEMKFLLDEATALAVEEMLSIHLSPDPHSRATNDTPLGYHITTLYCDTPEWSVLHRRGRHRLSKFRLRRYGDSPRIFLERKSKRGIVVRKRRSTIDLASLRDFSGWYRNQLVRNRLAPVCLIEYDRVAYCGASVEGPLRLTFDRRIGGALHDEWSLASRQSPAPFLAGKVVCEFKFRGALPSLFKSAIATLQLAPCGVSKYRQCVLENRPEANGARLTLFDHA
jgi:hypothetical protein